MILTSFLGFKINPAGIYDSYIELSHILTWVVICLKKLFSLLKANKAGVLAALLTLLVLASGLIVFSKIARHL